MPTALRRIQITRTPEVERALAVGQRMWPDLPLSERIARLAVLGAETASGAEEAVRRQQQRREALVRYRGAFADAYPPGYLEELREDWPE
ncbi:hypothetical protein [Microbacterium sp.]|uniref:hypothetical protein n=1 Tax=Microbacterium sp. TaxID=51671 RepID=UPI0039E4491C